MAKPTSKRNTRSTEHLEMALHSARGDVDKLSMLFDSIKVQVIHAEDASEPEKLESYTNAIEALCDMGVSQCADAMKRIQEARNG